MIDAAIESFILGRLEALTNKVESLTLTDKSPPSPTCNLCGRIGHFSNDCQEGNPFAPEPEEVNFVGNSDWQHYDLYSNTYNLGWSNHANLSWGGEQDNYWFQQQALDFNGYERELNFQETVMAYINNSETRLQSHEASLKNLETQICQLVNLLIERVPSSVPGETEPNPKELTLRNEKEIASNPPNQEAQSTEEHSAKLLKKLPPKLKDPGSFTIPCFGNSYFKALCHLGANINLMTFPVFRKLGMQEPEELKFEFEKVAQLSILLRKNLKIFVELYVPPSLAIWQPPRLIFNPG